MGENEFRVEDGYDEELLVYFLNRYMFDDK